MSTIFGVCDLETTSNKPELAHIVEWAAILAGADDRTAQEQTALVKPAPGVTIPPETSAVHHIIQKDLERALPWEVCSRDVVHFLGGSDYLVAHNADYEKHFLVPLFPDKKWICTYKCSLRVFPDAPSHSNEGLRYYLELGDDRGRAGKQMPHSALHDARVTTLLLQRLLKERPVENLVQWSNEIAVLPRCPIGKWRGSKWSEIDWGFLEWIVYKTFDMREDVKEAAKREMSRRVDERDAGTPL